MRSRPPSRTTKSAAAWRSRRLPEAVTAGPDSVQAAVRDAAAALVAAGCDTPRLDAELLLASLLGVDRARLVVDAGVVVDNDAFRVFEALVARRAAREPVAYILGVKEFRRLSLA